MNNNWFQISIVIFVSAVLITTVLTVLNNQDLPLVKNFNNSHQQEEVVEGMLVVKELTKESIRKKIELGKEFLFQMEDKELKGFHKRYYPLTDYFENRLHTVYSASIIYTLLYVNDLEEDERILNNLPAWGDFLLSMQNENGGFHYSLYLPPLPQEEELDEKGREKKFVVGTASLTIFTLLRIFDILKEPKYLKSAELAGDWLTGMQKEDGSMKPYIRYNGEKWVGGKKESLLYNGQVLSALSKLYAISPREKYLETARKIADRFLSKYQGGYIKGDYREKNPISNSWVVMSLMDFYKINPEEKYRKVIFELSREIISHQKSDPSNLLSYGQFKGAYSSSGNGWIVEVMSEIYRFCLQEEEDFCDLYKEAVIKGIRWVMQHTYTKANMDDVKNPSRSEGGVFWKKTDRNIRTDCTCHALNGYIRIFPFLEDNLLLKLN